MDKINDDLGVGELSGTQGRNKELLQDSQYRKERTGKVPPPRPCLTLGGGDRTLARNMEADQQMEQQRAECRPVETSCG